MLTLLLAGDKDAMDKPPGVSQDAPPGIPSSPHPQLLIPAVMYFNEISVDDTCDMWR